MFLDIVVTFLISLGPSWLTHPSQPLKFLDMFQAESGLSFQAESELCFQADPGLSYWEFLAPLHSTLPPTFCSDCPACGIISWYLHISLS